MKEAAELSSPTAFAIRSFCPSRTVRQQIERVLMLSPNRDDESTGKSPEAARFHPYQSDGRPDPPVETATSSPPPDDDPFDPDRLRLTQDFASQVGVRKLLTTVPVRKPDKTWWVRTY